MLHIITHFWGKKYATTYLQKLRSAVKRNLSQDYNFEVVTDDPERLEDIGFRTWDISPEDNHLIGQGCLVRLRMFDPDWQDDYCIEPGDRIVSLDLDLVITGQLDPLFDRDDDFTILQGVNTANPNPFNGSVWMLKAGTHADVWQDFSMEAVSNIPFFAYPDDQNWFQHKIPDAAAWGPEDGVYAFQKIGWPEGDELPSNARIVAFPGRRDPSHFTHLPWVKKHWAA